MVADAGGDCEDDTRDDTVSLMSNEDEKVMLMSTALMSKLISR